MNPKKIDISSNPLEQPDELTIKNIEAVTAQKEEATPLVSSKSSAKTSIIIASIIITLFIVIIIIMKFTAPEVKTVCFGQQCITGIVEDNYEWDDYQFYQIGGMWFTQVQRGTVQVNTQLHYSPRDVKDIPIIGTLNESFKQSPVFYVTSDLSEKHLNVTALATGELQLNLALAFKSPLQAACMNKNVSECEIVPIVTCENTQNVTVIEVIQASPTQIEFKNMCIKIQGEDMELVRAVDRLLLRWYGILQ